MRSVGAVYVDYHTAMKDERDGLPAELAKDGVHPMEAGYRINDSTGRAGNRRRDARPLTPVVLATMLPKAPLSRTSSKRPPGTALP
jgi:hypothetical protein